jgi:hypothetical protein
MRRLLGAAPDTERRPQWDRLQRDGTGSDLDMDVISDTDGKT